MYPSQFDILIDFADACKLNSEKYMRFALEGYLTYLLTFLDNQKILQTIKDFCTHDMTDKNDTFGDGRGDPTKRSIGSNGSDLHEDSGSDEVDFGDVNDMNAFKHGESVAMDTGSLRWDFPSISGSKLWVANEASKSRSLSSGFTTNDDANN